MSASSILSIPRCKSCLSTNAIFVLILIKLSSLKAIVDKLFVLITYIRDVSQILTGEDVLRGGIIVATIVFSASLRIIIPQATLRLRKMT